MSVLWPCLASKLRGLSPVTKLKAHYFVRTSGHGLRVCRFMTSSNCSWSSFLPGKDPVALTGALSSAERAGSWVLGAQIHGCFVKLGLNHDVFMQNNLIKMYVKTGVLDDGFKAFDEMPQRNVITWTLLISGALQCGKPDLGLVVFLEMMRSGFMPNEFALGSVLKVCVCREAWESGLCVYGFAVKVGMERNPFVGTSIVNFYAKLGDIEDAEEAFKCITDVDAGCWNAMIGGYALRGYGFEAVSIASLMRSEGIKMDKYTFMSGLQGCLVMGDLNFGKQIHGLIIRSEVGLCTSVMNALIDMYFKNGGRDAAMKVFTRMQDKDVVTWNTVFCSLSQLDDHRQVVDLIHGFLQTGMKPNHITFSVLFRHCGEILDLGLGLQLFGLALQCGFFYDSNIASSLVDMFSRCGTMEMAQLVFDRIQFKGIGTWNELISGYNLNKCDAEALQIFCNLLQVEVDANECTFANVLEACSRLQDQNMTRQLHGAIVKCGFTFHVLVCNSLIEAYVKVGLLEESLKFFNGPEILDISSWGVMISTLVQQGHDCEAIRFLNSLIGAGPKPDEFVFGSILNCCSNISAYYQAKSVHSLAIKLGFERHVFVVSAVLDAYAKGGDIRSARMAFDQSLESNDVIIYNAMIMAYACHGLVVEAMDIFYRMKLANLKPTQATFVSMILACNHTGLVNQGLLLFESMERDYGMKPSSDNYGCLVDMLSRNGYLEDAKHAIETMPYPPWPAIFRSLLSGCRTYGNRDLGVWASNRLLQLVPENDAAYVLLSKVYSESGSWEDAGKLGRVFKERGLNKGPGHSWIEVNY